MNGVTWKINVYVSNSFFSFLYTWLHHNLAYYACANKENLDPAYTNLIISQEIKLSVPEIKNNHF